MPCSKKSPTPNWLDKAKFLANYTVDGCSTTLKVYAEAGWAAEINLVMGIINTSPEDFVRFLIRPKGARTARHGIRGLKTSEAAEDDEAIVDTAKLAADTVRTALGFQKPVFSEAGTLMWEALNVFERGAFFLLFANVTEDFAFDWYSGILLAPESKCDIGRFSCNVFHGVTPSHPYEYCGVVNQDFPPQGAFVDGYGMHIVEGTWCITATLQAVQHYNPYGDYDAHFRIMTGIENPVPCGASYGVTCPAMGESKVIKIVRKVTAPDIVAVQASMAADAGPFIFGDQGGKLEGFRMF